MLTANAPLAEMLAIIREHVIAILAESHAGSTNHLMRVEPK